MSDVGRKTRGGCELLVFYCSPDMICDCRIVVRMGCTAEIGLGPLPNNVHGDSVTKSQPVDNEWDAVNVNHTRSLNSVIPHWPIFKLAAFDVLLPGLVAVHAITLTPATSRFAISNVSCKSSVY